MLDNIKKIFTEIKTEVGGVPEGLEKIEASARAVNLQFGGSRQRIDEIKRSIADATPVLNRIGGDIGNVVDVINQVSQATSKNVIASTKDVEQLFLSSQILNQSVSTLVNGFTDIGVQFSQVGPMVKDSVNYIQSVGANTEDVFAKTLEYMSKMNEFNFQSGILGITKMATQASVLRFDMNQTFNLAEQALSPEKAVQLSSAFQRLGVSVGDLTDPFQLMNKSLMDPEGLQDSLIEMTKQFTFFNDKTNSFEISPQGKLMLREIQTETGLSSKEMSKLALATADVDRKLKTLKPEIVFEKEEDKLLLANIAKMKDGKYVVEIDKDGKKREIELSELTNKEIKDLVELQKSGPKDLEGIQRSQMATMDVMKGDVRAILNQIVLGTVSAPKMRELFEDLRNTTIAGTETAERASRGGMEFMRDKVDAVLNKTEDMAGILKGVAQGDVASIGKLTGMFTNLENRMKEGVKDAKSGVKINFENPLETLQSMFKDKLDEINLRMKAATPTSIRELGEEKKRLERYVSQEIVRISRIDDEVPKEKRVLSSSANIELARQEITNAYKEALDIVKKNQDRKLEVDHNLKVNDWNITITASDALKQIIDERELKAVLRKEEFQQYLYSMWKQIHDKGGGK